MLKYFYLFYFLDSSDSCYLLPTEIRGDSLTSIEKTADELERALAGRFHHVSFIRDARRLNESGPSRDAAAAHFSRINASSGSTELLPPDATWVENVSQPFSTDEWLRAVAYYIPNGTSVVPLVSL